jgi:hypothetical protein
MILKIIKTHLRIIDSIYIFTTEKYENLINNFFDIGIIPQEYSKKIVYFSGEPSILTSKFFQYESVKEYFIRNIKSYESVDIKDNKLYLEYKEISKKRINR